MARARNIKPGFFKNEDLAECHPLARILFAGLWCEADREGRLEDRPKRLKAEYLPYDDCDCDALLDQLARCGFILRYEAGGKRYIAVPMFGRHQNPHMREPGSTIPAPGQHSASTVQGDASNSSGPADSPSLIPESKELPPSAGAEAPAGEPPADLPPEPRPTATPPPEPDPIFGTGLEFLCRKGVPERTARSFLGLLRKELRDDLTVAELLGEAETQDVSQPQAWLTKAAKQRKENPHANRSTGRPASLADRLQANANAREQQRQGRVFDGEVA